MATPFSTRAQEAVPPVHDQSAARETVPRKKSCEHCRKTKVRCDQQRPVCSRCIKRRVVCIYLVPPASPSHNVLHFENSRVSSLGPSHTIAGGTGSTSSEIFPISHSTNPNINGSSQGEYSIRNGSRNYDSQQREPNMYWNGDAVDFSSLQLVSKISPSQIHDRWLCGSVSSFNDKAKSHPSGIIHFVGRVFNTYPTMLLKSGHLPPYIHPSQLAGEDLPTPLANCLSLVRLWDGQVRGGEMIVRDTIKNEMERLYRERKSYSQMELLAAFQAYLTYSMMAYFSTDLTSLVDRQVIINLQDFGCEISSRGLVCPGEISNSRPDWESWIVASAKRRCLYTMYLFDNLFCNHHGVPTFLGEELASLPVPASKILWQSTSRESWEKEYNTFLTTWEGGGPVIDEFLEAPEGITETRKKRVSKWLATVDEFGMMVYAVCSITHGC